MAPILTDGPMLEGNKGIDDFHVGRGESLRATAAETWADSPLSQIMGLGEMERAKSNDLSLQPGTDPFGSLTGGALAGVGPAPEDAPAAPRIEMIDANDRVKKAGLSADLHLPDQPDIPAPQLTLMMQRAQHRREMETTIARGPQGFVQSALGVGTSFLVGAVDPVNLASAFVPVMGELRYGKMLASAGESAFSRGAIRAGVGAAEGAVGQAALEPLDWYAQTQDGRDFGMSDVLQNIMFGAVLGGGLHTGGGAIGDVMRNRAGKPLYPFGPGESLDGGAGTSLPAAALDEAPLTPAAKLMDAAVPLNPDNTVALVRADKFHEMLSVMNRAYVEPKRTNAKEFVASSPVDWNPPHVEVGESSRGGDRVDIVDGIHRWAAMRDLDMPVVPVEMDADSLKKARKLGLIADDNEVRAAKTRVAPKEEPVDVGRTVVDINGQRTVIETDLAAVRAAEMAHYGEPSEAGFDPDAIAAATMAARREMGPPSPAVMTIDDLPQRAKEDITRAGISSLVNAEPLKVGEMLEVAAQHDPRIAEAFDGEGAQAAPSSGATFTTAKGSTYIVHEDGTTTRNKAARSDAGHEGDSGLKQRSVKTVYVADDASRLSAAGLSGIGDKGARVVIRDGKAALLTWNDREGKWGAAPSSRNIAVSDTPALGMHPLELWNSKSDVPGYEAYGGMHAGNKITELSEPVSLRSSREPVSLQYKEEIPFPGGTSAQRYDIQDPHGEHLGYIDIEPKDQGRSLEVVWVGSQAGSAGRLDLGSANMRSLLKDLRSIYPQAETLTGYRTSGAHRGETRDVVFPLRPKRPDPAATDSAWRTLAHSTPDFDTPEMIAASKAADQVEGLKTKLDDRVTAAEKADAYAKQMYDMFAHRLPEADRQRLDDAIKAIGEDHEAREIAIVRAGSCLFGVA